MELRMTFTNNSDTKVILKVHLLRKHLQRWVIDLYIDLRTVALNRSISINENSGRAQTVVTKRFRVSTFNPGCFPFHVEYIL